jgi:hypothetical protein
MLLNMGPTAVNARDTLPSSSVRVTTPERAVPTSADALPPIDVVDSQIEPSMPVPPTRPRDERSRRLRLPPSTVTLAAPVDAAFTGDRLISSPPVEVVKTEVTVPAWRPAVTEADRVAADAAAFREKELDDVHIVASDVQAPKRLKALGAVSPALEPSTVTLAAPVEAPLEATVLLSLEPTDVNAAASVPPTATAVVSRTDRDVLTSEEDLPHTELDDVHTVVSDPLPPMRLRPLGAVSPTLEASTVTLVAPVAGPFEE